MIWIRKQELINGGCGITEMPKTPAKKEFENMLELLRDAEKFNNLGENDISASILTKLREYIENYTAKMAFLLVMSFSLFSCSTAWHYNKIERKDPNFWSQFSDTIEREKIVWDTVIIDGQVQIVPRVETVYEIIEVDRINPKSKFDYKLQRDQLRHLLNMEKERTKQLKSENSMLKAKSKHQEKTAQIQARMEKRMADSYNKVLKTYSRQETKQVKAENSKWLMFLIGLVVGSIFGMAFMFKHRMNVLRWLTGH
jgi:hypothetical protein